MKKRTEGYILYYVGPGLLVYKRTKAEDITKTLELKVPAAGS